MLICRSYYAVAYRLSKKFVRSIDACDWLLYLLWHLRNLQRIYLYFGVKMYLCVETCTPRF